MTSAAVSHEHFDKSTMYCESLYFAATSPTRRHFLSALSSVTIESFVWLFSLSDEVLNIGATVIRTRLSGTLERALFLTSR